MSMRDSRAKMLCQQAGINWHEAQDAESLAVELAKSIESALQADINEHGSASLVVSGGSTPGPVFKRLSSASIDWSKVTVTLADERWVPPGHADSNESLVKDTLLVANAAAARFVSLYRHDVEPQQAIAPVAADVLQMQQPFSVTILGMGGDGHTASLFPDAEQIQLQVAMSLDNKDTLAVMNPPSVSQTRITLTRAALLNSRRRILHMTGEGKQHVLGDALQACATDQGEALIAYQAGMKPIVGLLTSEPASVSVFWSP